MPGTGQDSPHGLGFPVQNCCQQDTLLACLALTSVLVYRDPDLAEKYRKHLHKIQAEDVPIEIKPVNPPDKFQLKAQKPKQLLWVRARGHIGGCSCPASGGHRLGLTMGWDERAAACREARGSEAEVQMWVLE